MLVLACSTCARTHMHTHPVVAHTPASTVQTNAASDLQTNVTPSGADDGCDDDTFAVDEDPTSDDWLRNLKFKSSNAEATFGESEATTLHRPPFNNEPAPPVDAQPGSTDRPGGHSLLNDLVRGRGGSKVGTPHSIVKELLTREDGDGKSPMKLIVDESNVYQQQRRAARIIRRAPRTHYCNRCDCVCPPVHFHADNLSTRCSYSPHVCTRTHTHTRAHTHPVLTHTPGCARSCVPWTPVTPARQMRFSKSLPCVRAPRPNCRAAARTPSDSSGKGLAKQSTGVTSWYMCTKKGTGLPLHADTLCSLVARNHSHKPA